MKFKTKNLATENTEVTEVTEMFGGTSTIRGNMFGCRNPTLFGQQATRCSATTFSVASVFSVAKRFF
jgi:hypothetical protein